MPSKKAKKLLEDYDEKYKKKAILEIMYKDPDALETIIDNSNLSLEEKFLSLLDRGMPSQHIPLLMDIGEESIEEILNELKNHKKKEEIIVFEKLNDPWTPDKIIKTMQEAMGQISRGDWGKAERNLIEILRRNSTYATAHFGMGVCSDMQGNKNLAAEWFKRAFIIDPISFNQAKLMMGIV
ncbi:MAG: tetratricopeptide repeat protein [Candidatus Heimdallarchaeota archaeon]